MGEDEGAQQSHSIMDGSDGSASNECFKHHPDERTMSPGAPEFSKPDPDDEVETNPLLDDDLDPNKADEDDDDALAAGPPIDIFSMAYIGYLPQYFAVGVINQGLPSMIYGVFLGYLNVPSHIYITGLTVVSMPWTFKFFFGMLSDCVPILKLRRKPYICIGWTICCGMMLALAFTPLPDPYYCRDTEGKYITHSAENVPAKACNEDAASSGGKFAVMMMFAIFGMVIADVAADGMTVEIARREPRSSRGYTQTSAYLTRSIGQACAVALIAFCMNGYEYSGTFSWTLSFNQICGILAVPPALMVPLSWFGINEEQVPDEHRDTFEQYGTKVWELLTGRAMFSVLVYQFCTPVVSSISTTAGGHVKMEWAGVKNLQNQLFTLFGLLLFAWGLWLVRKHFLHSSWRGMMLITSAVLIAIDAPFVFLTIFDVVRNQYFYLGETVLIEIPAAANFVVSTFVIVEMAADGTEGIVYGMLTTAHNLGHPLGRAIANQLYRLFQPSLSKKDAYIEDTAHFRKVVAWSFALSYLFAIASLLFLFFLPNQKKDTQNRKKLWGHSEVYAYTAVVTLALAMMYGLTVNFLAMSKDTMCLTFAGGDGCDNEDD